MKLNEERRTNIREKDLLKKELVCWFVIFSVMNILSLHEFCFLYSVISSPF